VAFVKAARKHDLWYNRPQIVTRTCRDKATCRPSRQILTLRFGYWLEPIIPSIAAPGITCGALVIATAHHEKKDENEKCKYLVRESSSFYRRVALPKQADQEAISTHFDRRCAESNGTLKRASPFNLTRRRNKLAIYRKAVCGKPSGRRHLPSPLLCCPLELLLAP